MGDKESLDRCGSTINDHKVIHNFHFFFLDFAIFYHPILDTRIFIRPSAVTLRGPSLKSETGWTEELWLNRVLLIL